ncbi:hypothetical protein CLV58_107146 [Spirosoma oryzae]|uniref:Dolichyl-phosphate-mannose-protein mannosyltransferase n=1 Tax=Spirosoma oryzae TaxID=1469603 RepID=A0A2T0T320_9BACT|nr:hypothetical protein [Spirosoma oryzae]PRY40052.1 hypothetical protein CLV58_107146 [Spirosoma oryzae]
MNRPLQLTLLLLVTGGLILGLCVVNPNRFTTVDSGYYLQSATNLLNGQGYVISNNGQLVWNGIFPIGYSILIVLSSFLTNLSVLWASKLVNVLAVSLSAIAWQYRIGTTRTLWLLSVWWLGGFLKILASTWSETVFLVVLAEWVWCLFRFLPEPTRWHTVRLFLVSCALFLLRYVGVYVVLTTLLLTGLSRLNRQRLERTLRLTFGQGALVWLLICSLAALTGFRAYFYLNNQLSGSPFGGERFLATEPAPVLAHLFGQSLLNELLLIRHFTPNQPTGLTWLGTGLQTFLSVGLYARWRRHTRIQESAPPLGALSRLFILTGVTYLLVLFALRTVSPFSGPNLRLMAPATFCLLSATLLWVSASHHLRRLVLPVWIALLFCSWLQLLPQADMSRKLNRILPFSEQHAPPNNPCSPPGQFSH